MSELEGHRQDPKAAIQIRARTPEPPYCWQNKEVRRHIREQLNGEGTVCSVLSLYDALTEIASNMESEQFEAGQPYIGTIAGISGRTVRRNEKILEELGIVKIIRPSLRGHNTYILLAFGHNVQSLGNNGQTFGHSVRTLGQIKKQGKCPPVEEHKKNREKTFGIPNKNIPNILLKPVEDERELDAVHDELWNFLKNHSLEIPEDYVEDCEIDWRSREGVDCKERKIGFLPYLERRWRYEQDDWEAGIHSFKNGGKFPRPMF